MNNYPSDIRQYDSDPRSPFYDDSYEVAVQSLAQEMTTDPAVMVNAIAGDEDKVFKFVKAMCTACKYPFESIEYKDEMIQAWNAWESLAEDCAKEEIEDRFYEDQHDE